MGNWTISEEEFTRKENWYGQCYELAIDYSENASDAVLVPALRALWSSPLMHGPFEGPYASRGAGVRDARILTTLQSEDPITQYGIIELSNGKSVGCKFIYGSFPWFILCIPAGMLDLVYTLSYPLDFEANQLWMSQVNEVLLSIAQHICVAAPFDLAVIGEEAGAVSAQVTNITAEQLERGGCLISSALFRRLQPRGNWESLEQGLLRKPWQGQT
jgi:hypothetical protein